MIFASSDRAHHLIGGTFRHHDGINVVYYDGRGEGHSRQFLIANPNQYKCDY